jgi:hypothetical protein
MNPQLITGITGGIDTNIDIIPNDNFVYVLPPNGDTSAASSEAFDNYIEETNNKIIDKSVKRKKFTHSTQSSFNDTQSYAEEMLKIEKEKLRIKKSKIQLMKINLLLKIKELENRGINLTEVKLQINEICDEF